MKARSTQHEPKPEYVLIKMSLCQMHEVIMKKGDQVSYGVTRRPDPERHNQKTRTF